MPNLLAPTTSTMIHSKNVSTRLTTAKDNNGGSRDYAKVTTMMKMANHRDNEDTMKAAKARP